MSLAVVYSRANLGINAPLIEVEVHLSRGLPRMTMVGLPEAVVKESKDRVRSAIMNSRFEFPTKRMTINLAPASLPKEGGRYDLAIALGILAASRQISAELLLPYEFAGELTLAGELRDFPGALPMIVAAREAKRAVILPVINAADGAYVRDANVFAALNLLAVCQHLLGLKRLQAVAYCERRITQPMSVDLSEVCGQYQAKRALEIAAAGGHSLLMKGPPGSGKTMLASRLPSILPEVTEAQALEIASIYSLRTRKEFCTADYLQRPYRSPHHSASNVALVGGGRWPMPGEVSLAHHGILFLDELPEFSRASLEALREPLEAGTVTISRAAYSMEYPARFQLIAAMNPCPCGYWRDGTARCTCSAEQVSRYQRRLSGPLLDRIDLFVMMSPINPQVLIQAKPQQQTTSDEVRQRVVAAQHCQLTRSGCLNAALSNHALSQHCQLSVTDQGYLQEAIQRFGFSARSYHRLLKVARTIADLANAASIQTAHVQEALVLKRHSVEKAN